jgi:hypothetical protein
LVYYLAPFSIPDKWGPALKITTGLLFAAALALAVVAIFPEILKGWLSVLRKHRLLQQSSLQKVFQATDHFFQALIETAGRGFLAYLYSTLWAIAGHALVASGIFLAIEAMGLTASWSAVIFTYTASIAGSVAMFMLPGSSVGWDALFGTTLSITANLPISVALAVTVIIRIQQMIVALIGVCVLWFYAKDYLLRFSISDINGNDKK